jgi:hypothetical protein
MELDTRGWPLSAGGREAGRRIAIRRGHDLMASARLRPTGDARVSVVIHVESGHLPPEARPELVEALLAAATAVRATHLDVALPLGDAELLADFRLHCADVRTRAAGATCLLSAELAPAPSLPWLPPVPDLH